MKKKTTLERFEEIKDLEVADEQGKTVKDILPYFCENVETALHRLESIDNSSPSEALECLEDIYRNGVFISEVSFTKQHPTIRSPETNKTIGEQCDTIKQALLKAQEPKQYLKWEDLEFKEERQTMKVLLNGKRYFVKYVNEWFCGWCNKVQITNGTYNLCILGNGMSQFFNDLHLERVEE